MTAAELDTGGIEAADVDASEVETKLRRLRELMRSRSLQAVVLRRPGNLAWLSGGGRVHVEQNPETGVAAAVVRAEALEVVTTANEAQRLQEEELGGLPATWTVLPWTASLPSALPTGTDVGWDGAAAGCADVTDGVRAARAALIPAEVGRLRRLGSDAAKALTTGLVRVEPGQSEHQVGAAVAGALLGRGIDPVVLQVAGEHRLATRRHALPTTAAFGSRGLVSVCARRQGLIVSLTRMIAFGGLAAEWDDRYQRLLHVEAEFLAATRPGPTVGAAFNCGTSAYATHGFDPEEWTRHHQGGPAGYDTRDLIATPEAADVIVADQAFAWNPTAPGLKVEDTVLATAAGLPEVVTRDPDWPVVEVGGLVRPLVRTA